MADFMTRATFLLILGLSNVGSDEVSVMEGDSITLNTDVDIKQDRVRWYSNDRLIARITGDFVCTDVQCNEGTERFSGRLKLDHQTGSLTIMNIRTSDAGLYNLQSNSGTMDRVFNVSVHGVSAAEREEVKTKRVKEGESVTLDPGEIRNTNDVMKWYFNEILITEITGDQSKICTDDQCDERFRDRLKLDHQTGSLTIMNIKITDTGEYKLQITSSIRRRRSIGITSVKIFSVDVIGSGVSSAAVGGIIAAVAVVLLAAVSAGVIYYYIKVKKGRPEHSDDQTQQTDLALMSGKG